MPVTIVKADSVEHTDQIARQAAEVLDAGRLVVFPTETVYGVAAAVATDSGVQALRTLKNRPTGPFTVHLARPEHARRYVGPASGAFGRTVGKLMPGPVTVVAQMTDEAVREARESMGLSARTLDHLYHDNTVGIRCPDHGLAGAILEGAGAPVVATSANRRGHPAPVDAAEAARAVGDDVDLIIDGGRCRFAGSSTIVRLRAGAGPLDLQVVREGVYDERYVRKLARWTLLVVCSGNTCRSPMAAAMSARLLVDQEAPAVGDLDAIGVRVLSAGIAAMPEAPATAEAIGAMARLGIDLAGHRAQQVIPQLIQESDLIICMTDAHRQAVLELEPSADARTHLLDPSGDIEDPFGSGPTGYQRCVELIRRRLDQRLRQLQ
jgi:tRNA threonylcarbamoyl adenosine modification protein (Sua5/YciO/YrdC/YwlC family)